MNAEITITWYENKIVNLWFGETLIWEAKDVLVLETNPLKTVVILPLVEAIRFVHIITQGITANRLVILLAAVKIECKRLEKLQANQENDNEIYDADIFDVNGW